MRVLFLVLLFLSGGALQAQVRGHYTIKGDLEPVIATWGMDPDSLSMTFIQGHEKADSVGLRNGKFEYSGDLDERYVPSAYLRISGPGTEEEALTMTIPVFLEPGTIRIFCRELPDEGVFDISVRGTPSNDLMSERMSRFYDLNYKMLDLARDSTRTEEEKMPLIYGMYEQQDSLYRYLYRDNCESDIAPMLAIQRYYGTNEFEDAGRELRYLDARFPGHPDLHDLESVWMSMPGIGVGDEIPSVIATDPEGNTLSLRKMNADTYLLLDFWSSVVGPSMDDFPALGELPDTYDGKPLLLIGINTDLSQKVWRQALDTFKPAGIQLWDEGQQASKAFHITSYPARYLVAPDGTVIAKGNFTELP